MKILDALFGRKNDERERYREPRGSNDRRGRSPMSEDERAVERYRYLLRTAPPETIEQAHAEAFSQLTAEQRQVVLRELSATLPPHERIESDDPQTLARAATRAEMRQPGTIERTFNQPGLGNAGIGMGGLMAGSFFSSIAGFMVGSAIANQFFDDSGYDDSSGDSADADTGDAGADASDTGAGFDSGDTGADIGAENGDFGGGDFGGGDFGGGDFGGGDF
jgi:hypothetical protein